MAMNIYDTKLFFVVQSKYPEVLAEFKRTFLPTTSKFKNMNFLIEDGEEYGSSLLNKRIIDARAWGAQFFGVFNDDLWFADGWVESVLPFLLSGKHWCVSPGYVETADKKVFKKAVELTKDKKGFVPHLYGANPIFNMATFKEIGVYDEQFGFSCEDLDWAVKFKDKIGTPHPIPEDQMKHIWKIYEQFSK